VSADLAIYLPDYGNDDVATKGTIPQLSVGINHLIGSCSNSREAQFWQKKVHLMILDCRNQNVAPELAIVDQ
jgi:hypothetical protein